MPESRESVARSALLELTPLRSIGALMSETVEEGVVTLVFASDLAGYPGWYWTVSLAELEGEAPTVLETELLPGDGALLAPDWVPWSERLEEYRAAQAAAGESADDEDEESDDEDGESHDADESDDDSDDEDDDDAEDDVPDYEIRDDVIDALDDSAEDADDEPADDADAPEDDSASTEDGVDEARDPEA